MENYTLMNFVHSMTGYYYSSSEKLEMYVNSKIAFKQLHFRSVEKHLLFEQEVILLESECTTIKKQYDEYLNTTGKVFYSIFFSFVLIGMSYPLLSSLLKEREFFVFILSTITIPSLMILWVRGFRHSNKGVKLANNLNVIDSVIKKYTDQRIENKPILTEITKSKTTDIDVCFYTLSVLEKNNIIQPKNKDSELYKEYLKEKTVGEHFKIKSKKDIINLLTTFIINGQTEGRKKQKDRNIIAFFSLNPNISNDDLNKFLCDTLVWEGKSKNNSYKTELSNGFNRNISNIYDDLDIINQSYTHPFVNNILILKQQINN